jgi:hypothetical protein
MGELMREGMIGKVLNDPGVHTWVKVEYRRSLERDPLDAYEDAKLLTAMLQDRMEFVLSRAKEA